MIDRPHAFGEEQYSTLDNVIFRLRSRQVLKRLPSLAHKTIADFGAGYDARLLVEILKTEKEAKGVAVDIAFADSLKSQTQLELVTNDLDETINVPDGCLDVVLSLAVLEHLHKPQEFLKEVYRVLRPGGVCILTTPGPTSKPVLEFMAFRLGIIDAHEIRDHKNYFSSSDLERMFAEAGFTPNHVLAKTFLAGMNNVVEAKKL